MASLRDSVKDYQEELRDGIAWVAFWKEGRSWNAELFHLEVDGTLEPFDRSRLEEIKAADPTAVILNGYYCGHLGENMSLDELTAGVRYHYGVCLEQFNKRRPRLYGSATTNSTTDRMSVSQGTAIFDTPSRNFTIGIKAIRIIKSLVATCLIACFSIMTVIKVLRTIIKN